MPIRSTLNFQTQYEPSFDVALYIQKAAQFNNIQEGLFEFTFVDDTFMKQLHKTHFNDDSSTDIITFNLNTPEVPEADIYICINEASKQAELLNSSLEDEIKTLIIHGILHCLGFTDLVDKEKDIMFKQQTLTFETLKQS